jgi:hypothetical protein
MHHKMAGGLLAVGLFAGMAGAAAAPAGASSLNLLSTTTTASALANPGAGTVTLTATVTLELVKGLLITPSGTVAFSGTNDSGTVALGSGTLTRCLLGLPSLLGLWSETCTATDAPTAAEQSALNCETFDIAAQYTGDSDLLAKGSIGYAKSYGVC